MLSIYTLFFKSEQKNINSREPPRKKNWFSNLEKNL